ncbi:MAG: alpha/beta hydrolase, partial [Phycisphaerales bacterium]|nr:alpha/beta hydrolase [Phycisphaerales bacterium]
SAGGHLASTLCTIADADVRPALGILLYPVITLGDPSAHTGSRNNLVPDPADPTWIDKLSSNLHVTKQTPPTFLFHTVDDAAVPIENALLYCAALRQQGVPFEAHLYERGRHGVGLAIDIPELATWPTLCANWLRLRGWVE